MVSMNNEIGITFEKASRWVLLAWRSDLWRQGTDVVMFDSYTLETGSGRIIGLSP